MNRSSTTLAVLALVVGLVVAPMAAAGGPGVGGATYADEQTPTATPSPDENATKPGEKLSGVVGVQKAEIDGEMKERTYGIKVAQANTDRAKADVVAAELSDIEKRLQQLEQRKQELKEARDNGSISEGEFRARMAELAANVSATQRLLNATENTTEGLPEDVLAEKGINVAAIQELKNNASNLSGPEVAKIAQSIAGKDVGKSIAGEQRPGDVPGPGEKGPGEKGPGEEGPGNVSEAMERAQSQVDQANQTVERANQTVGPSSSDEAQAALDRAQENLTKARKALADAQDARDVGDDEEALELAKQALEYAQQAIEHAQSALDEAGGERGTDTGGPP